jgi:hypothetical protein
MRRLIGAATRRPSDGAADLARGHSLSEFERLLPGSQFIQAKVGPWPNSGRTRVSTFVSNPASSRSIYRHLPDG